jgi:hypothetical protein
MAPKIYDDDCPSFYALICAQSFTAETLFPTIIFHEPFLRGNTSPDDVTCFQPYLDEFSLYHYSYCSYFMCLTLHTPDMTEE